MTILGQIAYKRWREKTGIPSEFCWSRLPQSTKNIWEAVAEAVLAWGTVKTDQGAQDAP